MNDFVKQQKMVHKMIWSVLLFSNLFLGYIVYSGMLKTGQQLELDQNIFYGLVALATGSGLAALWLRNSVSSVEALKKMYRTSDGSLGKNVQMTPEKFEQYNLLSDHEKKIISVRGQLLVKSILALAITESINVFGIVGVTMGLEYEIYYYFFGAAIGLTLMMFPNFEGKLSSLRAS